jgi:radical SAM superfamily enzyme YgiQ (UPF0313 family)
MKISAGSASAKWQRPDLVGITINVDTALRAYAIADRFREEGVPVVLGGIHASAAPKEASAHADAVCIGEAEGQWAPILEDAAAGQLRKIYRNTGPADLAQSTLARRDITQRDYYLCNDILCATRGCPYTCEFCYNSCDYIHHGYRTRPVELVLREIQSLKSRHVMFIDDNLFGNPAWTRELLLAMRPLHLRWHAAVSANIGQHPDIMDLMQESGCKSLFIGFESINEASVKAAQKKQNHPDTYAATIAALHERKIMVNASLAFGFDQDGPGVFKTTLDWLVANKIETMTAHILTPYPGTRLFKRMVAENRITDFDWSHYNTSSVVFKPAKMTPEELLAGYLWIYKEFYSLGNIARRLPAHTPNWIPFLLFNLGYRRLGNLISGLTRMGLTHNVMHMARRLSYGVE